MEHFIWVLLEEGGGIPLVVLSWAVQMQEAVAVGMTSGPSFCKKTESALGYYLRHRNSCSSIIPPHTLATSELRTGLTVAFLAPIASDRNENSGIHLTQSCHVRIGISQALSIWAKRKQPCTLSTELDDQGKEGRDQPNILYPHI